MTKLNTNLKPLLRRQLRRPRQKKFRKPTLKFSPTAWSKLRYLRDLGPSEVGAFGISDPEQLLCVQDIELVTQRCTEVTVKFDDAAVADFFESHAEAGRQPQEFGRIWIHTHPGSSALPSAVDVETFERCFGRCDWAVMCILSRNDNVYAELRWRQGNVLLPMQVEVDYYQPFQGTQFQEWENEYQDNVLIEERHFRQSRDWGFDEPRSLSEWNEFDRMRVLEEFGAPNQAVSQTEPTPETNCQDQLAPCSARDPQPLGELP